MRILKRTLLTGLCMSLATGSAFAQQGQQSNRRNQQDQQNQSQARRQSDSQQRPQYRVSPTGWVRIAADYDNDGQFDAIETMYVYDLERARQSSRQRANQDAQNQQRSGRSQGDGSNNRYSGEMDRTRSSEGMDRMRSSEGMDRMRSGSRGSQQMSRSGETRTYQQQRETVRGDIENLRTQDLAGSDGKSVMAQVKTDEGRSATVCLGPQKQLERLDLSEGDRVTIEGVRGRVNDLSVLLARKVSSDGQSVNVRMPDSRKLKRVRGEIVSKRNAQFRNQDEQHVLAKVRLVSGKEETVNLGPKSKVNQLDLQQGDDVALLVRPGKVNGQKAMIAEQLSSGGDTIEVPSNQRLTSRQGRSTGQSNSQSDGQRDRSQGESRGWNESQQQGNQAYRQDSQRSGQDSQRSGQDSQRSGQDSQRSGQAAQRSGQAALGIAVSDSENGVQVEAIYPNSPAQQSQLREGDEIVSIDGESINSARQVIQKIQERSPNEQLKIEAMRNGQRRSITVRLAERSQLTGTQDGGQSNR